MDQIERFTGCLLGLAAGDAVGTTVEFSPRDLPDRARKVSAVDISGGKAGIYRQPIIEKACGPTEIW